MIEALNEERQHQYLSSLTFYAEMADRRSQEYEYEINVLRFTKELGAKISKDGNQWCVLYGNNLQDGIAGFGDTPFLAMRDLKDQFYKK